MKVGFIGAGKVAVAIGTFWLAKGAKVIGYYSRSSHSAEKVTADTNTCIFPTLSALAEEADLIIITTPDDAIEAVGKSLSQISLAWEEKIVSHMSGVYSSEILTSLFAKGATVCSLHPLMSFGNISSAVQALNNTFFTLEGKGSKFEDFVGFLQQQGTRYQYIDTDQKVLYHIAACFLSNYFVALVDTGIQMLRQTGFAKSSTIFNWIKPLVEKTWENILMEGTEEALTGPISRGDIDTVRLHRQTLLKEEQLIWLELYKVLGRKTIELALQTGKITAETADNLYKELEKDE